MQSSCQLGHPLEEASLVSPPLLNAGMPSVHTGTEMHLGDLEMLAGSEAWELGGREASCGV